MMAQFKFDFYSFLAGFAAASILWLIIWRVRANWFQIRAAITAQTNSVRKKNSSEVEVYLKQTAYRRAQKLHLAASLFPLEDILIPPLVLAPPASPDSDGTLPEVGILDQVFPYMPDWPELAAEYGFYTRSLSEIAANKADIALIGRPGTGKTTALAHLTTEIVQKQVSDERLNNSFPFFLHILDLNPALFGNPDPADVLIEAAVEGTSINLQKQARMSIRLALKDSRAILLLDGLDELHPTDLQSALAFLKSLKSHYPDLQIIAPCSDRYVDGLLNIGFKPVAIAPWNRQQIRLFIEKWGATWKSLIFPQITKDGIPNQPDPLAMENWITTQGLFYTPFEWTQLVWGAYSGDLSGNNPLKAMEAHLKRIMPGEYPMSIFSPLAYQMIASGSSYLSFEQAEDILTRWITGLTKDATQITQSQILPEKPGLEATPGSNIAAKIRKSSKVVVQSVGEKALIKAIDQGLLIEHKNLISFSQLPFAAYLASLFQDGEDLDINLQWNLSVLTAQFIASDGKNHRQVLDLLGQEADPLRSKLTLAGRMMASMPANSELRIMIMRRIIGEIQQDRLPFGTRARLTTACAISNESSLLILFRQWLNHPSADLRRLAALACGLLKDVKSVNEITNLLADPEMQVHSAAAVALVAIPGDVALNTVSAALSEGTETLRRAIAEALAVQPDPACQNYLRDAIESDDLLVRRAAVFGISLIRRPWSQELLSKVAVEDAQWVVRNAAAQALEHHQQTDPYIPTKLPPFWESPWLITFAGKLGVGVSPDEPPNQLLFKALESGTEEDQTMALQYLPQFMSAETIPHVQDLLLNRDKDIAEKALQALWCLSLG